jgi:hypothetical protein
LLGADPKNAMTFQTSSAAKIAHQIRPGRPGRGGVAGESPGRCVGEGGVGKLTATLQPGRPRGCGSRRRLRRTSSNDSQVGHRTVAPSDDELALAASAVERARCPM